MFPTFWSWLWKRWVCVGMFVCVYIDWNSFCPSGEPAVNVIRYGQVLGPSYVVFVLYKLGFVGLRFLCMNWKKYANNSKNYRKKKCCSPFVKINGMIQTHCKFAQSAHTYTCINVPHLHFYLLFFLCGFI